MRWVKLRSLWLPDQGGSVSGLRQEGRTGALRVSCGPNDLLKHFFSFSGEQCSNSPRRMPSFRASGRSLPPHGGPNTSAPAQKWVRFTPQGDTPLRPCRGNSFLGCPHDLTHRASPLRLLPGRTAFEAVIIPSLDFDKDTILPHSCSPRFKQF